MNELLTYEEMRRRFDGKWVLIVNATREADGTLRSGRVIADAESLSELYAADRVLRPKEASYECFQELPEGYVLAL